MPPPRPVPARWGQTSRSMQPPCGASPHRPPSERHPRSGARPAPPLPTSGHQLSRPHHPVPVPDTPGFQPGTLRGRTRVPHTSSCAVFLPAPSSSRRLGAHVAVACGLDASRGRPWHHLPPAASMPTLPQTQLMGLSSPGDISGAVFLLVPILPWLVGVKPHRASLAPSSTHRFGAHIAMPTAQHLPGTPVALSSSPCLCHQHPWASCLSKTSLAQSSSPHPVAHVAMSRGLNVLPGTSLALSSSWCQFCHGSHVQSLPGMSLAPSSSHRLGACITIAHRHDTSR